MAKRTDVRRGGDAESESDPELIAQMRSGNGDALGPLFRRYARLVYRVAVDILHDTGEAEDVTQEVFLEVYRRAHLYDPARGSVRVWLLQYAYHRSLRRKDTLTRRAAYRGEPLDEVEGLALGPRHELTRDECRWVIRAGLAQLPDRQRVTLELTCFEELSLRDVAERLRVSLGCARHYYYRGLARLRAWAVIGQRCQPQQSAPALLAQRRGHE
jgi:RNA polymerase sigma-70 factor (ECF subfamily)